MRAAVQIESERECLSEMDSLLAGQLWTSINRFAAWLQRTGYATHDPYDVWGTWYGKLSRSLYYKKNPLGTAMTAPMILMEIAAPSLRTLFTRKDRCPTADAQLALAFLNLYEASLKPCRGSEKAEAAIDWLAKAESLADDLLIHAISGYHGLGWGYPFDWQHANGLMPKGTPHITATPYCYEVFARLFDLTGKQKYLEIVRSISEFVFTDLKDTPTGSDAAASSYTPHDESRIVNASAYRAFVMFDAGRRFGNDEFRGKAKKNLNFILQSQRADGAWMYAIDDPSQAFIDHFHTCFVLKNLHKLNRSVCSAEVERAISQGYSWYRRNLFDAQENPKTYAIAPRMELVRIEMYNYAEAITLGALLKKDIPEAYALSQRLSARLIEDYQLPAGHWVTRVYRGGRRHKVPFLRWPQSQLFHGLTNLLLAMQA